MNLKNIYLNTLIPQFPVIYNYNNKELKRYLDVFYDENTGVIIAPINTPGRVKASSGEFVTVTVDNLIVKSQYTNLYENITTANYDYWVTYTGILTSDLRDACTFLFENTNYKYIDAKKPYYKIIPSFDNSTLIIGNNYAFQTDNKSQLIQIILDPSGVEDGYYRILIDPTVTPVTYLDIYVDPSTLPTEQTKFVTLFCVDYDASYGAIWEIYEYGAGAPTAGGTGGGVTTSYVSAEILAAFNTNVSLGNVSQLTYALNSSIGNYTLKTQLNLTDTSLYKLTSRVNVIDTSISYIKAQYIRNSSLGTDFTWNSGLLEVSLGSLTGLGIYATNSSVNLAIASNASLGNISLLTYALNTSTGQYATNASVNSAFASNASLGILTLKTNYLDACLGPTSALTYAINSSIGTGLGDYATNSSVNLAIASNASLGILTLKTNYLDACLGPTSALTYAINSSIGTGLGDYATNSSVNLAIADVDASITNLINYSSNVSTNLSNLRSYTDGSLNLKIKETSIGSDFMWDSSGYLAIVTDDLIISSSENTLDISSDSSYLYIDVKNYVSKTYTDGSLNKLRAVPISDACLGGGLSWSGGLLYVDISTIAGGVTLVYVDGSLNIRDAIISTLATNASVGLAFVSNASLGNLTLKTSYIDACLGPVSKLTYAINSSLSYYVPVSQLNITDTSLYSIRQLTYTLNTSTGNYATNASVNSAFVSRDSSISWLYTYKQPIADYIKSTSTGDTLYWQNGILNVSTGTSYTTYEYVDGSLNNKQAQINSLNNRVTTLEASTGNATFEYVDGSLLTRDASIKAIYPLVFKINSSLGIYATNASVNASFATNASVNRAFASNASIGRIDVSLRTIYPLVFKTNASLGYVDVSTRYWKVYVDGSLSIRDGNISTLNSQVNTLNSNVNTLTDRHNVTESSLGYIDNSTWFWKVYVDGSLVSRDTSINSIWTYLDNYLDASDLFYTKTQVDASFALLVNIRTKTFQTLTISASTTWNMNTSYNAKLTLTQDTSLVITNVVNGDSGTLIITQDNIGSRKLGLPTGSYKNNAWILSDASSSKDIISFLYDGVNYYWNKGGPYA